MELRLGRCLDLIQRRAADEAAESGFFHGLVSVFCRIVGSLPIDAAEAHGSGWCSPSGISVRKPATVRGPAPAGAQGSPTPCPPVDSRLRGNDTSKAGSVIPAHAGIHENRGGSGTFIQADTATERASSTRRGPPRDAVLEPGVRAASLRTLKSVPPRARAATARRTAAAGCRGPSAPRRARRSRPSPGSSRRG